MIPPAVPWSIADFEDPLQVHALARLRGLKRWAANWSRLAILLAPEILDFVIEPSAYRRYSSTLPGSSFPCSFDFDSTLGFPGEGPQFASHFATFACLILLGFSLSLAAVTPPNNEPQNGNPEFSSVRRSHGDAARKAARAGIVLTEGRRVTPTTSFHRNVLFQAFEAWMVEQGCPLNSILFSSPPDIDSLNSRLVQYGRFLFESGKPYYHFSETINALTCRRPIGRRSLQSAWDLAFMWGSHEPSEHHQAMPHQVLIALVSAAWFWGWRREAAIFALAWGALLRIGEIFGAYRDDLVLPEDVNYTVSFALLRAKEPKTRYRAARHQAGKLGQVDLIEIVRLGFQKLPKGGHLWHMSGQSLRARLTKLLSKLALPTEPHGFPKALSLASFRPGGATYLIAATDSAEAIRRRGRWASQKVMEIYLQEVSSATYLTDISEQARGHIFLALDIFPKLLKCASPKVHGFFFYNKKQVDSQNCQNGEKWAQISLSMWPHPSHTLPTCSCGEKGAA